MEKNTIGGIVGDVGDVGLMAIGPSPELQYISNSIIGRICDPGSRSQIRPISLNATMVDTTLIKSIYF